MTPKIKTEKKNNFSGKGFVSIELAPGKKTRLVERGNSLVLEIGISDRDKMTLRTLRTLARKIIEEVRAKECEKIMLPSIENFQIGEAKNLDVRTLGELLASNMVLSHYSFRVYKSTPKNGWKDIKEIVFVGTDSTDFAQGLKEGTIIAECINKARDLANTPGGDMTPALLAKASKEALKGTKTKVTVLDKKGIEKLKMGALLGVSKGSSEDPRFIVMEYRGGGKEKPIVFVGKGITFDTGGINIKPSEGMLDMHLDMSGGAAVIGAIEAIARLGIKRNVIGLIPSAENMVSGASYRPGDVLKTMSGKTVDVLNTDAEGRLVLADALTYAKRYEPALVIDVATLTGGALAALGTHASAVMSKDDEISRRLCELGEASGDYLWPLPLWDEYIRYTKGVHGDIANIQSSGNGRYGSAINGGAFLSHFTDAYPWAHIDTAPRMVSGMGDHLAKGATGEPVRLLVQIARDWK